MFYPKESVKAEKPEIEDLISFPLTHGKLTAIKVSSEANCGWAAPLDYGSFTKIATAPIKKGEAVHFEEEYVSPSWYDSASNPVEDVKKFQKAEQEKAAYYADISALEKALSEQYSINLSTPEPKFDFESYRDSLLKAVEDVRLAIVSGQESKELWKSLNQKIMFPKESK